MHKLLLKNEEAEKNVIEIPQLASLQMEAPILSDRYLPVYKNMAWIQVWIFLSCPVNRIFPSLRAQICHGIWDNKTSKAKSVDKWQLHFADDTTNLQTWQTISHKSCDTSRLRVLRHFMVE